MMLAPDPESNISKWFTWKNALWLPRWNRMAAVPDGLSVVELSNLKTTFEAMDVVRDFFGSPIRVHCAYRPEKYNVLVGGATGSTHRSGMAVDFDVDGIECDVVRLGVVPMLETWGMRCEDKPGSNWVHLDTRPVMPGGHRFFAP